MIPARFDYDVAESVDQAIELLAAGGGDAKLLAGGHSLIPAMKLRIARPEKLVDIGRDVMLVTDYDVEARAMRISIPPGIEPRRVSVDAIEHWMIYQAHPDVGAILHVHAWMEGIAATDINYPCGTQELAESVADLIDREPDPTHAVIGLRNHGITATGDSLMEILDRIESSILRQVPMT